MKKGPGVSATETALVPFGDMLNHSHDPHRRQTRWAFVHDDCSSIPNAFIATDAATPTAALPTSKACKGYFALTVASECGLCVPVGSPTATAGGGYEHGHEVFDSYGHKSNSRYLLNYGFAIDQNIVTTKSNGNNNNNDSINHNNVTHRCCTLF